MPNWFEHYGLDRDPFSDGGVRGLFYPGGARQETVEQLQHLARFSDSLLLVSGHAGAGKTALARHFVSQCGSDVQVCLVEAAIVEAPEQLLRRVLTGFGISPAGAPALAADLHQFEVFCEACKSHRDLVWIVIDDAQHMSEDGIALLPQLMELVGGYARLILCTEPGWKSLLRQQLPEDVSVHAFDLAALDRGESYAYIHYRLKTAGLEGEPPFTADEFETLHRQSEGLPARINALAAKVLADGAGAVQRPFSTLPVWHFGVVAVTLLSLLLLYIWVSREDQREEVATPRPAVPTAESIEMARAQVHRDEPDSSLETELAPGGVLASEDGGDAEAVPAAEAAVEFEPDAAPKPDLAGEQDRTSRDKPVAVVAGSAAEVPEAEDADVVPQSSLNIELASKSAVNLPPLTDDEKFLLGLPGSHFTVQVMASDKPVKLAQFVQSQPLELRRYRKQRDGREWHTVLYGEFATREQAQAAIKSLPKSIAAQGPWVRTLNVVQDEIRAKHGM